MTETHLGRLDARITIHHVDSCIYASELPMVSNSSRKTVCSISSVDLV